ncbi:MAG: gluconokinase [Ilumatobacteraceae bacterium]|nr:gluconokinase [Ilumatobacteraceae bacterium]
MPAHRPPSGAAVCRVVVTGVAGSGKTTVGRRLAVELDAEFVDGDSLHSEANVAKMAAGIPLVDDDRWSWLASVRDVLRRHERVVVACSGLRRVYRDRLRGHGVRFVHLDLDMATAEERAARRPGHYMGAGMIASQFDALEPPAADEHEVVTVDATAEIAAVVGAALAALAAD